MNREAEQGRDWLKSVIEAGGRLRVSRFRPLDNEFTYHVVVAAGQKEWDFTVTHEFLEDLRGTREFQKAAKDYAARLEKVFENASPQYFYCSSGTPVCIEFDWPIQGIPQRAASFLRSRIL